MYISIDIVYRYVCMFILCLYLYIYIYIYMYISVYLYARKAPRYAPRGSGRTDPLRTGPLRTFSVFLLFCMLQCHRHECSAC